MRRISRLNGSARMPRRLLFLDCETLPDTQTETPSPKQHRLRLGVLSKWLWDGLDRRRRRNPSQTIDGSSYHLSSRQTFRNASELYPLLESGTSKRYETWLFAHKASFDCQVSGLFALLKSGDLRFDKRLRQTPEDPDGEFWSEPMSSMCILSDPPTIMALRLRNNARLVIVDTLNYFRVPLSVLGRAVGLPKLQMPPWDAPDAVWERYCVRDVEIIEKAMIDLITWLESENYGSLKFTAAGQSMQAYRTKFCPEDFWVHDNKNVRRLERAVYYGGEISTFRLGEIAGPVYQLDVNSLYPAMMLAHPMPLDWQGWTGPRDWTPGPPPRNPKRLICEVWIKSGHETYPKTVDGLTRQCRGSFPTLLCGEELAGAVQRGHVIGYRMFSQYKLSDHLAAFSEELYLKRLQFKEDGDYVRESFCKMLLTSLHGKFGQKGTDLIQRTDFVSPQPWGTWVSFSRSTGKARIFRCMDSQPFEVVDRKELKGAFPAVSAFITAAGRERMREYRKIAGAAHTFYQSVDSLIVDHRGLTRLQQAGKVSGHALGMLKMEAVAPGCVIRGTGHYEIGEKRVLVGRKEKHIDLGEAGYSQTYFECAKNLLFTQRLTHIIERTKTVQLPEGAIPGNVDRLGFVKPLKLNEELPRSLKPLSDYSGRLNDFLRDQINRSLQIVGF